MCNDNGMGLEHTPRAHKWTTKHDVECGLLTYKQRFDAILLEDVVFTPYTDD